MAVYGTLYDNPDDPQALLLQEGIQKEGLSSVVERIAGFPKTHELHHAILQHYENLKRNWYGWRNSTMTERLIVQQYKTSKRRLESTPLVIVFV